MRAIAIILFAVLTIPCAANASPDGSTHVAPVEKRPTVKNFRLKDLKGKNAQPEGVQRQSRGRQLLGNVV